MEVNSIATSLVSVARGAYVAGGSLVMRRTSAHAGTPLTWQVVQGMLMKLPEQELKMALDPAAVSFSAAHAGQVLVVEQAVAREGHVSQSPKYKG